MNRSSGMKRISRVIISFMLCLALMAPNCVSIFDTIPVKANSSAITVSSGIYYVDKGVTVKQDIYVTDRAALSVYGRVDGTIYVQTTEFCDLIEEEDGTMWTPENLYIDASAEVNEVIIRGKARLWMCGVINTVSFEEGCLVDGGFSSDGRVNEVWVRGAENLSFEGSVEKLYMTSGDVYIAPGGYVGTAIATGGHYQNQGVTDYLRLSGNATGNNFLTEYGDPEADGYIKLVWLEYSGTVDPAYDSVPEIFANFGTVDSVVDYGSFLINFGTVHNVWAKGGRIDLQHGEDFYVDNGEAYTVDRLYSIGAYIYADNTKYVKNATIIAGECNFANAHFENLVFEIMPKVVLLGGSTDIKKLTVHDKGYLRDKYFYLTDRSCRYIDELFVTQDFENDGFLQILEALGYANGEESGEELGIECEEEEFYEESSKVYRQQLEAVKEQNLYSVIDINNRNPEAAYAMSTGTGSLDIRKTFASLAGTVLGGGGEANSASGSISGGLFSGAEICLDAAAEAWFEFDVEEGIYTIDIATGGTEAFAALIMPEATLMAGAINGSDSVSIVNLTAGKGYVAVYGAETTAAVRLSRKDLHYIKPEFVFAEIDDISGKTNMVSAPGEAFSYRIYDETSNNKVKNIRTTENGILILDDLNGHSLSVIAEPFNSEKYMPAQAQFSYNSSSDMKVKATMYEYGIYSGSLASSGVSVYIYDSRGYYLQRAEIDNNWFCTTHLLDGHYTAVFIKDGGDFCFGCLDDFEKFGLVNHEDYIKDSFEIKAGEASRYYNVSVPDIKPKATKYVNPDKTDLRTNAESCVPDTLVNLVLDYAFDGEGIANAEAVIVLMNGTRIEGDEIVLNGSKTKNYKVSADTVTIALGDSREGKISLCISGGEDTEKIGATAQINLTAAGTIVSEFVGVASTDVVLLTINAPKNTSQAEVYVYGKALPYSLVKIYDGNVEIGSTYARAGGGYDLKVPLYKGLEVYEHSLYAVLENDDQRIASATTIVRRNSFAPNLESFVMHYEIHGTETVLSLTGEEFVSKNFIHIYWPGTKYKFEIELSSAEAVTEVYMGSNSDGEKREIPAYYDSSLEKWIAVGVFDENPDYIPEHFYIRYVTGNAKEVAKQLEGTSEAEAFSSFTDFIESEEYKAAIEAEPVFTELGSIEDEDGATAVYLLENEALGMNCLLATNTQVSVEPLYEEDLLAEGYVRVDEEGSLYIKYDLDRETGEFNISLISLNQDPESYEYYKQESIDSTGLKLMAVTNRVSNDDLKDFAKDAIINNFGWINTMVSGFTDKRLAAIGKGIGNIMEKVDSVLGVADIIKDGFETYNKGSYYENMRSDIESKADYLRQMFDELKRRQKENPENDCFPNVGDMEKMIDDFEKEGMAAAEQAGELVWGECFFGVAADVLLDLVGEKAGKIAGKSVGVVFSWPAASKAEIFIRKGWGKLIDTTVSGCADMAGGAYNDCIKRLMETYSKGYVAENSADGLEQLSKAINDKLEECFPSPSPTPTPSPSTAPPPDFPDNPGIGTDDDSSIIGLGPITVEDPSGYVYAGVQENRISGVTCTVYYKDENGNAVLWNAEEFDQINPQITDPTGAFFWMVPKGEWKVVCEAEGYETYETEWLNVPPPQTEVNINLLSIYAPKIENFSVNTKYATVEFDMYVYTDSFVNAAIKFTDGENAAINYTVIPVTTDNLGNESAAVNNSADKSAAQNSAAMPKLAKKFLLVFDENAVMDGAAYSIKIPGEIRGYNDKTMEGSFNESVKATLATTEDGNLLQVNSLTESSGFRFTTWQIVLIAVAVLVIIAGGVILVVRKKKMRK